MYGAFPPRALPRLVSTVRRSDSRSALTHFAGSLLIGLAAPSPPASWHPAGLTAGAETGLSCSHDGCANVPRPLRRWVLRGCCSKFCTPSLAFVRGDGTRLPVAPLPGVVLRRGRLRFMLRTAGLHPPKWRARPRASTPRSPQTSAGYYKGDLVPPLAGLAPASHRELQDAISPGLLALDLGCAPSWGILPTTAMVRRPGRVPRRKWSVTSLSRKLSVRP